MPPLPSYWDYLKLDRLLTLQDGFEADGDVDSADELHFIVVHQVYELWFKLVLRSLRLARDRMSEPRVAEETVPYVVHHLRRISTVLQIAVQHWKVVETLTPQDFLAFRDKLTPASGFQSFQLREIEIVMGLEEAERIAYGRVTPLQHISELGKASPTGRMAWERIEAARIEESFLAALNDWLYRTPIHGSSPGEPEDEARVRAFVDDYLAAADRLHDSGLERLVAALGEPSRSDITERFAATKATARSFLLAEDVGGERSDRVRRVRAASLFIESYRDLPLLAWPRLLLDAVVEMEEQLLLFRHAHARMVERVIGRRVGTGGSGGVDYLDKTLSYRVFRDLWAIRTVLLQKSALPPLQQPHLYGFARE
jgi:tryptophan 2,3-dioxygenase